MTIASDKKLTVMSDVCAVVAEQMNASLDRAVEFENALGLGILTEEAELLLLVKSDPGHPAIFYQEKSDVSPRRFATIISKLVNASLIDEYPFAQNEQDMRLR